MIGKHFADAFTSKGDEVYGIARNSASSRMVAAQDPRIFRIDILDSNALDIVVAKIEPDIVIHLAAQAFNGTSWQMERMTHETNYFGTLNILKSCRKYVPNAKVLLACSSAEYGMFDPKDCPLKEDHLLRPVTPYGVSKVATESLGFQYFANYAQQVYLPRLFIHVGTGHPPATAIQNFAMQVALITKGKKEPIITVGNIETARDFIDVRDGVDAMMLLLSKGNAGEPVNICTGTKYKISDILDILLSFSKTQIRIEVDKQLLRSSDEPLLVGDNTKIKKMGWKQHYTIEQTLTAVYKDWLQRIE